MRRVIVAGLLLFAAAAAWTKAEREAPAPPKPERAPYVLSTVTMTPQRVSAGTHGTVFATMTVKVDVWSDGRRTFRGSPSFLFTVNVTYPNTIVLYSDSTLMHNPSTSISPTRITVSGYVLYQVLPGGAGSLPPGHYVNQHSFGFTP